MLCQAASQMAIKVIVLDPVENCPAGALSHCHVVGSYDDSVQLKSLQKVLTFEIEHVNVETLEKLEQRGLDVQPKASTIRIIQCQEAGDLFGYPFMIKSKRLAYDGRGNAVAKREEEISSAVQSKIFASVYNLKLNHNTFLHLRAILGLQLGDPSMKTQAAIMYNILGEDEVKYILRCELSPLLESPLENKFIKADFSETVTLRLKDGFLETYHGEPGFLLAHQLIGRALGISGATVHWYDKPEMRKQRKMGHITIVGPSMAIVETRLKLMLNPKLLDGHTAGQLSRYLHSCCSPFFLAVTPRVGIIMGSDSDLPVMKDAARILNMFDIPNEVRIVSAHRTPDIMFSYASSAGERGIQVIIAGAGGAAHLPGMVAALTPLPVIGVPVRASSLDGLDSLLSIVQVYFMPTFPEVGFGILQCNVRRMLRICTSRRSFLEMEAKAEIFISWT
ncbi:hypothetical protein C3L33_04871, partial [Rhododendron williamsianum]